MKKLQLLLGVLLLPAFLWAQTIDIKGTLTDSTEKKSTENAVISLIGIQDSTLLSFSRAAKNGSFTIAVPNGTTKAMLLITHPYFADYTDTLSLTAQHPVDLGIIAMLSKIKMMEEIVVRSNRTMYLKGDTTVFTADSFKVASGANVEELLRKLPGIQVDRKGKITAMGENVKKVLVDGEEFFGSDPGIATKNLRADVVQEVQVFDKKSDQSAFTGIDDGKKDKTINLKLKDDKKKGYFGKLDAGAGLGDKANATDNITRGRYYGAAMLNAFKAKRKIAAYGISSNTGFMNLNWDDAGKYGSGSNVEIADGMMAITTGDNNSSEGIPTNYNGGLHYSSKFNREKQSINAAYRYVQVYAPGTTQTFAKNFTPDSAWNSNSTNQFTSASRKHSGNATFEAKLDSMNILKLTTGVNFNFGKNTSNYYAENINDKNKQFINTNNRNDNTNNDQAAYNANLLWMHKFKKNFRTLSINTAYNYAHTKSNGFLYSKIDFYKDNAIDNSNIIDQQNIIKGDNTTFATRLSYTEPLAKDFYLETSYSFQINTRNNLRNILAKSASGRYDTKIDSLSNQYEFNDMANTPGLGFRYSNKKLNVSIGSSIAFTRYQQLNKTDNTGRQYHFNNHFPKASVGYKIKPNKNIGFNYDGNTTAPGLDQLQPIKVNTDPLNIYVGNPNLRPSFSHQFDVHYNFWKMLSERYIGIGINAGFTQNAFASLSSIKNAVRTSQTVNTNGNNNASLYMSLNKKIKKWNVSVGVNPSLSMNNNVDFIADNAGNALKNTTTNYSYNFRFSMNKDKDKVYSINVNPYFGMNFVYGSVNALANARYWSAGVDMRSAIHLPKKFEITNNVDATFRQKDPRFPTNNNFILWNADIQKKIIQDQFIIKFTVNDILNQSNGYNRNFSSSTFTETYSTVLRRHYLLGIVWNFTKMTTGDVKEK